MNNILFIDINGKIHFKKETSVRKTLCGKTLSLYSQINLLSEINKKEFSYKNNKNNFCQDSQLESNKLEFLINE